jgi:sugar fermentation stimulation protein A
VEVKNVTLADGDHALFPDSVTERGAKHLRELEKIVSEGGSALQLFIVQRGDSTTFRPAEHVDATYAAALRTAVKAGVQVVALGCTLTAEGITVDRRLPVVI